MFESSRVAAAGEFNSSQGDDGLGSVVGMQLTRESMHQVEVRGDNAGLAQQTSSTKPQGKPTTVTMSDGKKLEFPAVPNETLTTEDVKQAVSQKPKGDIRSYFSSSKLVPSKAAEKWCDEQRAASSITDSKITQVNKNSGSLDVLKMPKDQTANTEDHPNSKMPAATTATARVLEENEIAFAVPVLEAVAVYPDLSELDISEIKSYVDDIKSEADIMAAASAPPEESAPPVSSTVIIEDGKNIIDKVKAARAQQIQEKKDKEAAELERKLTAEIKSLVDSAKDCCGGAEAAYKVNDEQLGNVFLKAAEFFQQAANAKKAGNNNLLDLSAQAAKDVQQLAKAQQGKIQCSLQEKYKDVKTATLEKVVNYLEKAITATKDNSPTAIYWQRAARLAMKDLELGPNCNCSNLGYWQRAARLAIKNLDLGSDCDGDNRGFQNDLPKGYQHGDLDPAIICCVKAATIAGKKPSSLTKQDRTQLDLLVSAIESYERGAMSSDPNTKNECFEAARYYQKDIHVNALRIGRGDQYLKMMSAMGDFHSMIANNEKVINQPFFKKAKQYIEEILFNLERADGRSSFDQSLWNIAATYYNITLDYLRGKNIDPARLRRADQADIERTATCVIS